MDKDALASVIQHDNMCMGEDDCKHGDRFLAALGANGYVVVPQDALRRFMAQADFMAIRSQEGTYAKRQYNVARAAVVEAVGPTT